MRIFYFIIVALLISSCLDSPATSNGQNERMKRLEERLDSLQQQQPAPMPIRSDMDQISPDHVVQTSQRCTAMTKKGAQCKRMARSGGRCWQHGG